MNDQLLSRLIDAIDRLESTIDRSIQRDEALTGILSRTGEMQEQRKIKREVIGGRGGKSLEFAKKLVKSA